MMIWRLLYLALVIVGIGLAVYSTTNSVYSDGIVMRNSIYLLVAAPFILGGLFGLALLPFNKRYARRRKLMNEMIDEYERQKRQK
jgi:phosphate/sulfate permease